MKNNNNNSVNFNLKLMNKYFISLKEGEKKYEGRMGNKNIKAGDIIEFSNTDKIKDKIKMLVISVEKFENFEDMIRGRVNLFLPELEREDLEKGVSIYEEIPGYKEKVKECGCIAIEVRKIEENEKRLSRKWNNLILIMITGIVELCFWLK